LESSGLQKEITTGLFHLYAVVAAAILAVSLYLVLQWNEKSWLTSGLAGVLEAGKLRVLTRSTSTTYYYDEQGPAGPEFDLTLSFADYLGVEVEFVTKDSIRELLDALAGGEGHLAAAGITRTPEREAAYRFGPDYFLVQQQVVCRRGEVMPEAPADLVGRSVAVLAHSSYVETLTAWRQELPELRWHISDRPTTEQILLSIVEGKVDCTLADSNIVAVTRRYYPDELAVAFPASEPQPLAWVIPRDADRLASNLYAWLTQAEVAGEIASIMERYYGHLQTYDFVDVRTFRRRVKSRLPGLRPLFEQTAHAHGFPWTLIAAMAYQESHWDATAESPTGVRGIMMLTENTARAMGVKDRLDPVQSVDGGVRYLRRMYERLPDSITGEDRVWLALAAYNVGLGHIIDARRLASVLGYNPDTWHDMAKVMPLLARKRYYNYLKHGRARGWEPVHYVRRIRNYEEILAHALKIGANMDAAQSITER
jgi:membrane-bound lytic murein transglycosylase F